MFYSFPHKLFFALLLEDLRFCGLKFSFVHKTSHFSSLFPYVNFDTCQTKHSRNKIKRMDAYSNIYFQEGDDSSEDENMMGVDVGFVREPIVLRGIGNITIFGLNSKFSSEFPNALMSRVAPEEYQDTIGKINKLLKRNLPLHAKLFLCGCLCCCCTLGCSIWPAICYSKKTLHSLNRLLDRENKHLYNKLGLRWYLSKQRYNSSSLIEYVIIIEFLPKVPIYRPD